MLGQLPSNTLWPGTAVRRTACAGMTTVATPSQRQTAYSALLPCTSDACLSSGSLKYMHHFGLEPLSTPEEHWVLQASLTHPISGGLFSLVSVLGASALATED